MKTKLPKVSFELFPPKSEAGTAQLIKTVQRLHAVDPEYFSVTYGAGGSTQNSTQAIVTHLKQQLHMKVTPHISCVGSTKADMQKILDYYLSIGIDRLLVLRGDLPSGYAAFDGDFRYARDLVAFIRETVKQPLTIEVAVYPECHPQAKNMQTDLHHFKEKVQAGADRAVTQYFYNADAYGYLLDECEKLGIDIPIVPGIMPIANVTQLVRFSKMCGAEIPQWIQRRLEGLNDDVVAIKAFGIEIVAQLCERLLALGAPELHFYTLNKSEATIGILHNLGFSTKPI